MDAKLIKVIERLAKAQEESNRINQEFINYRIEQDEKNERENKEMMERSEKFNQESLEQMNKVIAICQKNLNDAIYHNSQELMKYVDIRLNENNLLKE